MKLYPEPGSNLHLKHKKTARGIKPVTVVRLK